MDVEIHVSRSWVNVLKMLEYRGVDLGPSSDVSCDDIVAKSRMTSTFGVKAADGIAVVFHVATSSPKKSDVIDGAGGAPHVVLVINTGGGRPNIATVKAVEHEATSRGVTIEFWTVAETQYNVSDHVLVPRHVKVADDDVKGLLEELMVTNRFLLPAISSNDPMARYLNLRHGDIAKIIRPSPTAGTSVAYRCCRMA